MALPYTTDESGKIASDSGIYKLGNALTKMGRGIAGILTITAGLGIFGFLNPVSWIAAVGFGYTTAALLSVAGGVMKGASEMSAGNREKGIKEMLKGAAEGAFVYFTPSIIEKVGILKPETGGLFSGVISTVMPSLTVLAAEPLSLLFSGRSLTANVGEVAAVGIDAAGDILKPKAAPQQTRTQGFQGVYTGAGYSQAPTLQAYMGVDPATGQPVYNIPRPIAAPVPAYAQGSLSTVPATVAFAGPEMQQNAAPQAMAQDGKWQQYVTDQRTAAQAQVATGPAAV